MSEGTHESVVDSIEVRAVGNADTVNSALIKFKNGFGEMHAENIFLWSLTHEDLSFQLKKLVSCAVSLPSQVVEILEELNDREWTTLDQLVGCRVGIDLEKSYGYRIIRSASGFDATLDGIPLGSYSTLNELKQAMETAGVKQSYTQIKDYYRIGERNDKIQRRQDFFNSPATEPKAKTGHNNTRNVGNGGGKSVSSFKSFF